MKKQRKQMLILLGLLIVVIGGYLGAVKYSEWSARLESAKEAESIIYVTNFTAGEVETISYDYEGAIYSFTKQEDQWIYDGDNALDIKESSLNYMVVDIAKLEADNKIENVTDLSQYGLEEPTLTIVFKVAGKEHTLYMGDYNDILGKYYVQLSEDDSVVYTVSSTLKSTFAKDLEDLVEVEEETETTEESESVETVETETQEVSE